MAKKIVIRHLRGSTLAGKTAEFEARDVVLGRSQNAEVRFDANDDSLVSGQHARITLEGDSLFVEDLGSSNGTFVNGAPISGKTLLRPQDKITLGPVGPELVAALADPAGGLSMPATIPTSTPRPQSQISQGRLGEPKKSHVGMSTLMGIIGAERASERSRVLRIGAMVLILSAIVVAASIFLFNRKQEIVQKTEQFSTSTTVVNQVSGGVDWSQVASSITPKVYCVMLKRRSGPPNPIATAWSLAKGKLGTNSHVAYEFYGKDDDETMIARPLDGSSKDLRIKGVRMHPGYLGFEKEFEMFRPCGSDGWYDAVSPCDVGILEVADEDVAKQADPIPLASDDELKAMGAQSEVCLVGFPMEKIAGGGLDVEHPYPFQRSGRITRVNDVFMSATDPDQATLFCHDISSTGGASGSPIFNKDGKVVGVHSAGDIVGHAVGGARIMIGGFSYAQSVRFLRQLVDGNEQQATADLVKFWHEGLLHRVKDGLADPDRFVLTAMASTIFRSSIADHINKEKLRNTDALDEEVVKFKTGVATDKTFKLKPGVWYILVYLKDPSTASFKVEMDEGKGFETQNEAEITEYSKEKVVVMAWNAEVLTDLDDVTNMTIRVTAKAADGTSDVPVGFYLRYVPTK